MRNIVIERQGDRWRATFADVTAWARTRRRAVRALLLTLARLDLEAE